MTRKVRTAVCLVLAALVASAAGAAHGRVYAPRVVSPHNADAYSMKTFAGFHRWRDLEGDARAWEVYRYLADTRTGLFHMNEVLEGRDVLSEYRTIRDPVKIINVYGYGYCAIFGPTLAGVCEDMGLGPARTLVLPAWSHVATEVFYGGAWHYLDVDVRAAFRRPDGSLASLDDARRDASLWTGRGPLFFPNDPLEATRAIYEKTPVHHYHRFNMGGHTMDYVLRQGETFTRWWTPQGGRWHHAPVYHQQDWLRRLLETEPRGPKPNHRHFTVHNHGNGRLVYRPDLTAASTDFADGVYDSRNVRPGPRGLTLVEPGNGYAVVEVRSPYIIVPLVGRMETPDDDCEASVVEVDAAGAHLAISLDGGLAWRPLEVASWPARVDLTRQVAGTYGYLLKMALAGKPGEAVVRSLAVTTWVQVAPAALPSLGRGANAMAYRTGDHFGFESRVVEIRTSASDPEDLLKHCAAAPEDYDPSRKTGRIRGPFVVRVDAPPGTRIAWFSAGGNFATHQREAARRTRNTLAWAAGGPKDFTLIDEADVPADTEHWHYNVDREVRLQEPAPRVWLRYVGDPAVNNVRVYAHCVEDAPRPPSPVRIRHGWRENGRPKTFAVTLAGPGAYTVTCDAEPENDFIEFSVPSDAPGGGDG